MSEGSVNDIPDAELIRRVLGSLRRISRTDRARTVPLWTKVATRFCLGSTYSMQLCRRFGFNPDEQVQP